MSHIDPRFTTHIDYAPFRIIVLFDGRYVGSATSYLGAEAVALTYLCEVTP